MLPYLVEEMCKCYGCIWTIGLNINHSANIRFLKPTYQTWSAWDYTVAWPPQIITINLKF